MFLKRLMGKSPVYREERLGGPKKNNAKFPSRLLTTFPAGGNFAPLGPFLGKSTGRKQIGGGGRG